MKIRLLNHAGILIEYHGLRLVCDPWLEGTIYANSMRFLAPSNFDYQEFETVNFIWFSGEQADRFSKETLQKIPLNYRENITILYYQGFSKQLVRECHELGFLNAIELTSDNWIKLSDDFSMLSEAYEDGAWACFNSQEISVLNCSNTPISYKKGLKILKKIGGEPEWLLTRFNFNTYVHQFNTDENELVEEAGKSLSIFAEQLDLFDAQVVIPIGDFIYYSNEENHNLTSYIQSLQQMMSLVNNNSYSRTALLFINDMIELGVIPATEEALSKWANIPADNLYIINNQEVKFNVLEEQVFKFNAIFQQNKSFLIRQKIKRVHIYITDYEQGFELHLKKGIFPTNSQLDSCDVALSSEVLFHCLKEPHSVKMLSRIGRVHQTNKLNAVKFYNLLIINKLYQENQKPKLRQLFKILFNKMLD